MTPTALLPGTLCDARLFAAILPGLAAPRILDHRSYDCTAAAAMGLIDEVPAGSIVIGFSLGGWIALDMLARWPDRFEGAVLISGNAFPDDPANAAARRARVAEGRRIGLRKLIENEIPLMLGKNRLDGEIPALIAGMAEDCGHDIHGRQAEMNIHRPDHRATVADCPVPMLVIAGEEDRLAPRARYVQAASAARSRLVLLAEAGHFPPLETPAALLAELRSAFPGICA